MERTSISLLAIMIDTHAHIYLPEFAEDQDEVIQRFLEAGGEKIFMPNIDSTTIESMLELEGKYPEVCRPMMGLHPGSVKADFEKELREIESWLQQRSFAAVGEIGLDFYWDRTYTHQQIEALSIQIEWAVQYELPIVLHTRESFTETYGLIKDIDLADLGGVFHCFGGTPDEARQVVDLGFYLGLGGVSTFKNGGLDGVVPGIPLESIVLETDSPYLAPVPYRGKRNEPSFLTLIAQRIADLQHESFEVILKSTSKNAGKLFK